MIYYVRNKAGDFFKLDYPCFGVLSHLDDLASASWRHDIWKLDGTQWITPPEHGTSNWNTHSPISGFEVDDLETVYLPTHGQSIDITHPFFSLLTKRELPTEICRADNIRMGTGCIVLEFQHLPCDELFMPLFAVREITENSMCRAVYELVLSWDVPASIAIFIGASFYKSNSSNYNGGRLTIDTVFYPHQEDGGTFTNGKVGDLVAIMNGDSPRYMSARWGDIWRGYPAYGITELDREDDDYEEGLTHDDHDQVTNRVHHMNDSLVLQRTYENEFLNKQMTDSSFNRMSEQEFRSFVMELLQYVNYSNQSGT